MTQLAGRLQDFAKVPRLDSGGRLLREAGMRGEAPGQARDDEVHLRRCYAATRSIAALMQLISATTTSSLG